MDKTSYTAFIEKKGFIHFALVLISNYTKNLCSFFNATYILKKYKTNYLFYN